MTTAAYTELYEYAVTVPAGTAKAAPRLTALAMPSRIVDRIEVMFPPGPNGNVGLAIGMAGQPVLPANAGAWIVANAETVGRDLVGLPESGAWQAFAYNTGTHDHTVQVRFWVHVAVPRPSALANVPDLVGMTGGGQG